MTRKGRMCFRSHPFLWSTVVALPGDNEALNGESRDNTGNFLAARQLATTTFAWARKGIRPSH